MPPGPDDGDDRGVAGAGDRTAGEAEDRAATGGAGDDRDRTGRAVVLAPPAVEEAIVELVENAVVHGGDAPTVEVTVEAGPETVTVAVADDGPGIPEVEAAVVAGDREMDQLSHASGMGLWLVAWVVRRADGEVRFERGGDDGGTTVRLELPAA